MKAGERLLLNKLFAAAGFIYATLEIIHNAEQLGQQLRNENGVQAATEIIEAFINKKYGTR